MAAAATDPFEALGEPTRGGSFRYLGTLHSPWPCWPSSYRVSRPAVSRHLRVLKEAGFVEEVPDGTRRV